MKALRNILVAALAALSFTSCAFREVFVEGTLISIRFEGDMTRPDGSVPELFEAVFFDAGTGERVASDFIPSGGGQMHLSAGDYRYVIYNFDLESTFLTQTENIGTLSASTSAAASSSSALYRKVLEFDASNDGTGKDASLRGASAEVLHEPDAFFVATGSISVPHRSGEDEVILLNVKPVNLVHRITLSVEGITGAENVASVTAFLTDLSGSVSPATEATGNDLAAFYLTCTGGKDSFASTMNYFGPLSAERYERDGVRVMAFIVISGIGGERFLVTRDVTDFILDAADKKDIHVVVVCSVDVPAPVIEDDGFRPTLDDWFETEVPVPIG